MTKIILITGANGFVGSHLVNKLSIIPDFKIRAAFRSAERMAAANLPALNKILVGNIDNNSNFRQALKDCKIVIHTAARVHVMKELRDNPLAEYRKVNVEGTLNLARQAASLGVERFIFLSSIKVNGEETLPGVKFRPEDLPAPKDPYAISKLEAEEELLKLPACTKMQMVIIRAPLIYGPGVKGNFERMIRWINKGYPLPLKSICNKRSFLSVYNLIDLIIKCIEHPNAVNQVFLARDSAELSTPELLKKIAQLSGKPLKLFPMPQWLLKFIAKLTGHQAALERLCGSLQLDTSKTSALLNWHPSVTMDETLELKTPPNLLI